MNLEIALRLCFPGSLFIGGGMPCYGMDKALVRAADGNLVIPASTVKGRLRDHCERVLRSLEQPICHPPNPAITCPHFWWDKDQARSYEEPCAICVLFGSPWRQAALRVSSLACRTPEGFTAEEWRRFPYRTAVRPGVSISRARRAAASNRLFTVETAAVGVNLEFEGCIRGQLPRRAYVAILRAGLQSLVALGGNKSRGLGWVERPEAVEEAETGWWFTIRWEGEPYGDEDYAADLKEWGHD